MKHIVNAIVVVLLSFMTASQAATNYVNGTAGNDSYDGLAPVWDGVHGPKQTIQAAVNIAASNDTVQVAAGTYSGPEITLGGHTLTIQSESGAASTILDGGGVNNGFDCTDADVVIRGFKFVNALAGIRAGALFNNEISSTIELYDCVFSGCGGNDPMAGQAGVYVNTGVSALIADSVFEDCGPGVFLRDNASGTISNCLFTGGDSGSAQVYARLGFSARPTVTILDSRFINNIRRTDLMYASGGAVELESANTLIRGSSFISNQCENVGGAICIYAVMYEQPEIIVENCLFIGNYSAGDMDASESGGAIFARCRYGLAIRNCTFTGNSGAPGMWGQCLNLSENPEISNCIFSGNGRPLLFCLYGESYGPGGVIAFSDVQGGFETGEFGGYDIAEWDGADGGGNIDADPKFYSASAGNYHLRLSSPCVDSGASSNAPADDLDGFARPQGGGYDMGCYEFADTDGDQIPDWWENLYYGGPTNANPSALVSNGINTTVESYIAGLNPSDPAAVFRLSSLNPLPAGNVVAWTTVPGPVYNVYWTSNLLNGFNTLLQSNCAAGVFTDLLHGAHSEGFYRIEVKEP